jgi:hypothetical protein
MPEVGRDRLACRQTAVIRRESLMPVNGESAGAEGGDEAFGEQQVLETAAGEKNAGEADAPGDLEGRGSELVVEHERELARSREVGRGFASGGDRRPIEEAFQERLPVHEEAVGGFPDRPWARGGRRGRVSFPAGRGFGGGPFDLQGGFAFEAGFEAKVQEGGDGIEEPAEAGGARGQCGPGEEAFEVAEFPGSEVAFEPGGGAGMPAEAGFVEQPEGAPPRVPCGGVATGEGKRAQPGASPAASPGQFEEFPAPDGPVVAEPGSVPGQGEGGWGEIVVGEAGPGVGFVVLDAKHRQAEAFRVLRRVVIGVQVGGRQGGRRVEQPGEVAGGAGEGFDAGGGLEVADVLAGENLSLAGERDRILEVTAQREDDGRGGAGRSGERGERERQWQRQRRVAAGAAQHLLRAEHDPGDRIIDRPGDGTIVNEEQIRDGPESGEGFLLVDADRVVADVAAGGDQGETEIGGQEVVDRRVRQHEAEPGIPRGDAVRDAARSRASTAPPNENDGRGGGSQEAGLGRVEVGEVGGRGERGTEEGQRFGFAVLALPQAADGLLVVGSHQELESAQTLEGDDPARPQGVTGRPEGGVADGKGFSPGIPERELGSAVGAGDRLGMEPAVRRVFEFALAGGAEGEPAEGGALAVVGEGEDDAEPGAAMGAVGEGMPVASVGGIEDFATAFVAGREVGQHPGGAVSVRVGCLDAEARVSGGVEPGFLDVLETAVGGAFRFQAASKGLHGEARALDFQPGPGGGVANEAGEFEFVGEPVGEGAEPDALNETSDPQPETGGSGVRRGGKGRADRGGQGTPYGRSLGGRRMSPRWLMGGNG